MFRGLFLASVLGVGGFALAQEPISITILHTNDLHARVEPARIRGKEFGGYARQATLIRELRAKHENSVLLNGGDTFQGTLFFNVYEGLADAAIMNMIGYDAMAVGNHEFDRGPAPLGAFAKHATFPLLAANLDVSGEPTLKDVVKPYAILDVGGQKLGVVGGVTPSTPSISSPGDTVKFNELAGPIQAAVDELISQGVNKIVVLTHIGFGEDLDLAAKLKGVDAIVGGHSHSLIGSNHGLEGWPQPRGSYPTMVKDAEGRDVPVVQAWEWGKVVGSLSLDFDAEGRLLKVADATVIPVDESVQPDPAVAAIVSAFKKPIEAMANAVVGEAAGAFPRDRVGGSDSPLDRIIADAMLEATKKAGAVAAFMNAGGVRAPLEQGPITFGELKEIQPFDNTLVLIDLTGTEILKALEHGATSAGLLLPSEGTQYTIDRSKPEGQRVSDVIVAGAPLDPSKTYTIVTNSFIAAGGDAHEVIKAAPGKRLDTGLLDIDAFVELVRARTPIQPSTESRIMVVGR